MNEENAYTLGLKAITFIMSDHDLCNRFMALTGLGGTDLRERLQDRDFLASCLDFLLVDEENLLSFCHDSKIGPQEPMHAYQVLGGNNSWESI